MRQERSESARERRIALYKSNQQKVSLFVLSPAFRLSSASTVLYCNHVGSFLYLRFDSDHTLGNPDNQTNLQPTCVSKSCSKRRAVQYSSASDEPFGDVCSAISQSKSCLKPSSFLLVVEDELVDISSQKTLGRRRVWFVEMEERRRDASIKAFAPNSNVHQNFAHNCTP